MPMPRITFATTVRRNLRTGVTYYIDKYLCPINPVENKKPRMKNCKEISILDGRTGYQYGTYNSTTQTLVWNKFPSRVKFYDILTQLRSYRGKKIMMKEGSAGADRSDSWVPILVVDVKVKYPKAPGVRHYADGIEMDIVRLPFARYTEYDIMTAGSYPSAPPESEEDEEEMEVPDP